TPRRSDLANQRSTPPAVLVPAYESESVGHHYHHHHRVDRTTSIRTGPGRCGMEKGKFEECGTEGVDEEAGWVGWGEVEVGSESESWVGG
ncbi:hypothetical protein C0995_005368, partial [Termitomyces sp. Mi166